MKSTKLRSLILRIFNKIENNNNINFLTNGEGYLLSRYIAKFSNQSMLFIDIGANVGHYSQMIIKYCEKSTQKYFIHAFEPVNQTFDQLSQNLSKQENIILNQIGISDRNEELSIYTNTNHNSLSSIYQRDIQGQTYEKELIKVITLDSYCAENNIHNIDFLKIDIEGHELAAFLGMKNLLEQKKIKAIQFEYGGANIDSRTFLKDFFLFFNSLGYSIYKIMPNNIEKRNYHPSMENFNYANYVASIVDLTTL